MVPVLHAQALPFYPAPGSPFTFTTLPGYFNVGDFNGDGNPDVLIGNSTLLLGDGHGKFTKSIGPPLPPRSSVIVADFNNDGRSDIAVVGATSPLMVYLGNKDGTFTLASPNTLNIAGLIAVGDFNGDGNVDLLASASASLVLLLGDGRGGFTASPTNLPTNIGPVQAADFNGDGHLDLVVAVYKPGIPGTIGQDSFDVTILLGDGRGNFTAATSSYRLNATSVDITVGDFNGDGKPDVVVHYQNLPLVVFLGAGGTVLLGDGAGGLRFASSLPGVSTYSHLIVSDFNGDGKQDLAVWSVLSTVSILLGDGAGNFTNAPESPYNTELPFFFPPVIDVIAADFNKDGRPDLAVLGNETFATFALLLNGVGSITTNPTQVTFNAGAGQPPPAPITVTVSSPATPVSTFSVKADQPWLTANPSVGATGAAVAVNLSVNTNGLTAGTYHGTLSVTSPNFLDGSLAVTLNISNPSNGLIPATHSTVNTGRAPAALALADFNGDGNLDLAVANSLDNTVTVLLGDGSDNFTAQAYGVPVAVPAGATSLRVADLNGDGKPDLIVSGTQSTAVLLNTGTGLAAAPGSPLLIVGPVAVADFDGNGTFDIADTFANGSVYTFFGDGTGGFIPPNGTSTSGPASAAVAGDFNGDGRPDVALVYTINPFGSFAQVFLNNAGGGGAFTTGMKAALPNGVSITAAAAGDFNGDGKLDITLAASGTLLVLLGDGKGSFNSPAILLPLAASTGPQGIGIGDLNGDGKLDIVVASSAGVTMFLGDGAGGFAPAPGSPVSVGVQSSSVVVGDLNHDGVPDLVVGNLGGNNVSVFLGSLRNSTTPFRLTAQRITISPLALTFFQSASQSISIAGVSIGFNATVTIGGNWLQVSPATGLSPATVTASVNTAGLMPGSYSGQITIAFNDGTPSQTVSVTLNIAAPAQIVVSSAFLQFTAERGSSPPPQNVQVTFDGAFTATVQGNAPWLTVLQANASNLLILVNPAGLSNGVYDAVLAISAPGASTAVVRVRMTVQDGPQFLISTKQVTFTYPMGGPGPAAQTVSVNATGRHFNFTAASNQPWLAVTPQAAMTPVFLNLTASTAGMKPGVYDALVTLSSADAANSPQSIAVRLIVLASAPIPTVSSVLNAATLAAGPLAPGSLFTILGTNLAGASVSFGGVAAPVLYVSPTQINGQVPFEAGLGATTIVVGNAATTTATIAPIAPGLFQTATGRAAVLNQDGSLNDVSNPAAPNSIVSAFLTGQGAIDPPVATGASAPINPLSRTNAEVAATFDGQSPADVVFAGLAPTLVGVLQVNLRVPMLPMGDHTLVISIGGMPSNAAPVAIGPTLRSFMIIRLP